MHANFFRRLFLGVAVSCFCLSSLSAAPPTAPTKTRLVDYYEQVGIDTTSPRFGWVVNDSDRGERQTAYQILVAASAADLGNDAGTLWDSGKVSSAQQFGIPYAGAVLAKTTRYFWKVRTWDKDDQVSPWSAAANFVTGFFQAGDWNAGAQWIRRNEAVSPSTDVPVMFRKTFTVSKTVKQAFLYATGLGQFVASLNGGKVGNHELDPAWTDYDKAVNYVTFDVTSQIAQGSNVLGMMLGSGWLNAKDGLGVRPFGVERMLTQLHLDYTDGTSQDIVSDPTWKVITSPFTATDIHGIESYDARLDQAGWKSARFDDSAWANAVAATAPTGVLSAQSSPPVVTQQVFTGTNISSPSTNNYVFDFGQNMQAQFEIKVSGTAGTQITLTPGEYLNGDGTVNPGRSALMTYTLKGGGTETWRLTFSAVGMRYVQVGGVSTNSSQTALPYIQGVTGYWTYTASDNVGSFTTSDASYNKIRDLSMNSLRSNLTSIHSDGPNLEKLGWQEVVWLSLSSTSYQHDLLNLFTKIMKDVREAQRTNGLCSTIAPNYFYTTTSGSNGQYDDSPAWGASIFSAPWQLYQIYGDTKILSDNYAAMKSYLAYLKSKESGGLIKYGLGDWMAPAGTQPNNVEGAVYVLDTRLVRDVATALGNSSDASFYGSEYTRVLNAYNAAYFDSANGRYNPVSQGNLAIPYAFGMVPAGREQDVFNALAKDIPQPAETTQSGGQNGFVVPGHLTTGDVGTTFLWRTLADAGQHDLVQSMIMQTTAPSYLSMINAGETAMAENWNYANIRSHNHDMYCGISEWLYRTPGGISSLQPGYAKIQLKPGMPSGLGSVTATYNSVRGMVGSAWSISGNTITWNVQVPANATARICVPTRGTSLANFSIQESGTPIYSNGAASGSVAGLTYDSVEGTGANTYVVWNAGSGSYQFAWQFVPSPSNLVATGTTGQVALTWSAASGAASYHVKRATASGGPYTAVADGVGGTGYTDTSVANGTAYFYVVSAQSAAGESANSPEATATTILPGNLGFETPSIPGYQYNPTGANWSFTAASGNNGSGIAANNSGFTNSNSAAPEGAQVAFLQGISTISESLPTTAGVAYSVIFSAAQRANYNASAQTWDLRKDGTAIASYAPAQTATAYTDYTAAFVASATSHTLAFVGTNTRGGDNTVFLDNVRLVALGTVIGTPGSYNNNPAATATAAFDGNLTTFFDSAQANGVWVGLDLGAPRRVTAIRYAPRAGFESRMNGGKFQGSNTADFSSGVVDLLTLTAAPAAGVLTSRTITKATGFQYVRYLSPNGGYGNIAEFQLTSVAVSPLAPAGIGAAGGANAINLQWTTVPGAATYNVKSATTSGGTYTTIAAGLSSAAYTQSGLGDGITRFYVVSATNEAGESINSSEAAATTFTAMEKWRLANFGSIAASGNGADNADPDGDGATNAQEYAAGTDPNDSRSSLKISKLEPGQSGWLISFPTVSGKTYRLETSTTLQPNSWTTVQNNIAGTGSVVQVPDATSEPATQRFYRFTLLP